MIKSIFSYAEFLQDKLYKRGEQSSHVNLLKIAAERLLEGYIDLEEATNEDMTRIDAYGNEISPDAVIDAVNYVNFNGLVIQNKKLIQKGFTPRIDNPNFK